MSGFDPERLVLVVCTVKTQQGEFRDHVSTGYFLTAELVLTAAHAIVKGAVDIKVRQEGNGQWHSVEFAPVWSDFELDAALLRITEPLAAVSPVEWHEENLAANVAWTSTAYPIGALREGTEGVEWKTLGLQGIFHPHGGRGQGSPDLDLSVEAFPEFVRGWEGISGAPVFVEGKLAGIIKSALEELGGRRLAGTSSVRLLQNAGFRLALSPKWLDDLPEKPWILVLLSENEQNDLRETVAGAIKRHRDPLSLAAGKIVHDQPIVVSITDALQSPGHWLKFVKAMCAAPIMLVDVTGFQPGILLALGVRAVVRRGVTITSTAKPLDETELSQLPFNIQETKLVCHGGSYDISDRKFPLNLLGRAICDGLRELRSHPRYLDLPAYDAVRCPVPDSSTGVPSARESIVVLCPFNQSYEPNWRWISGKLASHYPKDPILRMVDISSPRLVGQALYEHIRWATTCVVDWTGWRPNVFFEFGVRVASSGIVPVCLIDDAALRVANAWNQMRELVELFKPTTYSVNGNPETVRSALRIHDRIKAGFALPSSGSVLPNDATYRISVENFDWEQEEISVKPHDILRATAEIQLGKDPQKQGVSPVLFSENFRFANQLRRSVQERWIAAWYYLRNRYPPEMFQSDEALRNDLIRLGEAALNWLPRTAEAQIEALRGEIKNVLREFAKPYKTSIIRELKVQAKNRRDAERYSDAISILQKAIDVADVELTRSSEDKQQREIASELADCYGLLGGVQRRWALDPKFATQRNCHLRESISNYDKGYSVESNPTFALLNSYNMVNRLTSRILYYRSFSSTDDVDIVPVDIPGELEKVRQRIREQIAGPRRGDVWALADLAMVELLLGISEPAAAYAPFNHLSPPDYAYASALAGLRPLAELPLPVADKLKEAVALLEQHFAKLDAA